ncbi:hypothetical protein ACFL6U_25320 [Planctomycetota bacterium]
MKKDVSILLLRWTARILTIIPLTAVLFITFEDAPHHYPWSSNSPSLLWSLGIYIGLIFLFFAWRWEAVGILCLPCFLGVYVAIVWSMGLYPHGLFACCIPGALFLILTVVKKWPDNKVDTMSPERFATADHYSQ